MTKKHIKGLLIGVPISLFFTFTVVLYGPLGLYLPNSEEFWFTLRDLLKVIIPFSVFVFLAACLFFFILPEKLCGFFQKLVFGISLGLYVQGNYLNINYGTGVLDGTEIQWDQYRAYGIGNTTVWAVCIALPFIVGFIVRRKEITIGKILVLASLFLTIIQVPALISQVVSYHPNENTDVSILADGRFELADQDNVIVFILDTLDEAYFTEFLEGQPDYVQKLNGFVHFDNTLTSGARTPVAVPSMFTGVPFTRTETYSQYKKKVWSDENALSVLHDAGYDVGFYSEAVLFSPENAEYISNFTDGGTPIGSKWIFLKKVYKLDLYKFVPHFLKKYVWFDTAEFDQVIDTAEHQAHVMNDFNFMEAFRSEGYSLDDDLDKAVRIYHMRGAHKPYRMGADGSRSDDATVQTRVVGVMNFVSEMLEQMKELGIYDDATIIITADHGDKHKAEQPIFLLKQAGDTEEYRTSHAPVSLFDLPLYLTGLAGKKLDNQQYGMNLQELQEGGSRERHFFCHAGSSSETAIEEYVSHGDASDPDQLTLVQTYEGASGADTPYELGTKLSFGVEATGNIYAVEGFGRNTGMRTVLQGPLARLEIPIADLPSEGELDVSIDFRLKSDNPPILDMLVYANGEEVIHRITDQEFADEGMHFSVPVSSFDESGILTIELKFPEIPEDELEEEVADRTQNIRFISMTIEKAD